MSSNTREAAPFGIGIACSRHHAVPVIVLEVIQTDISAHYLMGTTDGDTIAADGCHKPWFERVMPLTWQFV
ncbi:MAG: hypothetical protein ACRDVC_10015 [Acidimicrobiales bacterium]